MADDNIRRAMKNPEYKKVVGELSEAERAAAKKEALNLEGLPQALETVRRLKARKAAVLAKIGMTEKDFEPQYHCVKCNDTGFVTSTGVACDCYYKRE